MERLKQDHALSVLIIGCGTWGSSTALHLARRGYENITVLDPFPIPSAISAGNDINKIVWPVPEPGPDADDETYVNSRLANEASLAWEADSLFAPHYHDTGYVIAASKPEHIKQLYDEEQPTPENGFLDLNNPEDFRRTMPEGVLTGDFPHWKGWYKKSGCGWVHARKAMTAAAEEAQKLGVRLITGSPRGNVTSLLIEGGDIRGVLTADGLQHYADRIILCVGANANQLLDMKDQLRATAWTLGHIKMTEEEAKLYRNLPVLFNVERGFFMEPDEDNHELKICDEHPGYCNWQSRTHGVSTPFARHAIPKVSETGIRLFLRETMPHLAERPLSFARICWCADTPDRNFLISAHPDYPSLTLGVGGSGHGFKYIPVIGKYIADCMERRLDERMHQIWRWRPETAVKRDWTDVQGRMGGSYTVRNFADLGKGEWTEGSDERS